MDARTEISEELRMIQVIECDQKKYPLLLDEIAIEHANSVWEFPASHV